MNQFMEKLSERAGVLSWGLVAIVFALALLFLAMFFSEMKEFKFIGQETEFRNTITVQGKGEITVIPDTSEFSFAIIKEAKTASEAQKQVTMTMNGVIDYLKKFGVAEKDIKTTSYNIAPRYEYGAVDRGSFYPPQTEGPRHLVGYEVSHWVTVKVRGIDTVGEIVGEVGTRGATNISNVTFTIDDDDKARADARREAIKDAKEKADVLAKDLGVRIIKVVSYNEGGGPIFYRTMGAESFAAKADGAPPEIPAGENTITSNVTIIYAID